MNHYAGIDVSLEVPHVCVIDGSGKIVQEARLRASLPVIRRAILTGGGQICKPIDKQYRQAD
jgi:hypothetical protein